MNKNIIHIQKKFKLRDEYEKTTGQTIRQNREEYFDWLECQLILEREKNDSRTVIRAIGTTMLNGCTVNKNGVA